MRLRTWLVAGLVTAVLLVGLLVAVGLHNRRNSYWEVHHEGEGGTD